MRGLLALAALIVTALGVVGCDRSYNYVRPNISPDSGAIITGSRSKNADPMGPDTRIYIASVDGKLTGGGPFGWDERTPVTPGPHLVEFGVSQKAFLQDAWGFGTAQLIFEAGRTYTLKATDPTPATPDCALSTGWIEADDGRVISERVPVRVLAYRGAEIPVSHGGYVTVTSRTTCSAN